MESAAETDAEIKRLNEVREGKQPWKKWGPYLSERQWGTVREDYSDNGDAWNYFSHDQARSRAYRWGEDGLGGVCDDHQVLCFSLALWNGQDPILKERLFGLTNSEGNHGEDVKEYYFYLDSTPTHSYMKYLYKYPQQAFPYSDIVEKNRGRSRHEFEYELLDTGVFDDNRYFDVFVEYAKAGAEDLLIKITAHNRGDKEAPLHILPTLLFRNTWSWTTKGPKPEMRSIDGYKHAIIHAHHTDPLFQESLPDYYMYCQSPRALLFCENETNNQRLFGSANNNPFPKDGINNFIVHNQKEACNPAMEGTKVSPHYEFTVPAGGSQSVFLRLTSSKPEKLEKPFAAFDGKRPVYGGTDKFQNDPHWKDNILFYEYFHGDNGAGLGASHQTGWTGLIARIMRLENILTKDVLLTTGAAQKIRGRLMSHWKQ